MKIDPSHPPAADRHLRLAIGRPLKVDPTTGAMSDLSLLTAGREAKGHGFYIDERSLATALDVVKARGGRLKGYRTHDHAGPVGGWMAENGSELDVAGFFSAIAIKGDQLVAGSFEFYDSYKASSADEYTRIVEMATKTPELLALSIEPWFYLVYVGEDGVEYSERPKDIALRYDGMPAMRVTELWAAAFVSDGAANDGLFAKLGAFAGKQKGLRALLSLLGALPEDDAAPAAVHPAALNTGTVSSPQNSSMKIIVALQTKLAADPKRLAAAMAIVGQTPADKLEALTVEQVEESLRTGDLTEARTQVTNLTAERDTLRTTVTQRDATITSLTAERDDWKNKFEALKASGHGGDVNLGAGAAAGASNTEEVNPWLPETKNLSEQARITKANPTLAATLKAAAKAAKPAKK